MDALVFLLVVAGVGGGIFWRISRRRADMASIRWSQLVEAVAAQFPYTTDYPFRDAEVKAWVKSDGLEGAVARIRRRWVDVATGGGDVLFLGERRSEVSGGAEIEEQASSLPHGADSREEFRHLQEQHRVAEAALAPWYAVAEHSWPVFVTADVRSRHSYVLGKTGSGKSTFLKWLCFQDAHAGRGLAFLTPEGETIDELLGYLPSERLDELVYFNPADPACRWHLNPFWLREGEDFDRKAEAVFSLLLRLLSDVSPRVQEILRNVVYALLEVEGATLLDVPGLLNRTDSTVRERVIENVRDPETRAFWRSGYLSLPVNAHLPITTRLVPFLRPRAVRRALCQPGPGIPLRELMDGGGMLLCNLSDGLIGESASSLLGGLLVSELQLAAVSRADTSASARRPFYLYLDEFQSFVDGGNASYEKLLSRSRKYALPMILAHQQTGQLPPALLREILGNVSVAVAFQTGRDDASRMSREFLGLDGQTAPPEALQMQDPGDAWVRIGQTGFPFRVTRRVQDFREEIYQPGQRAAILAASRTETPSVPRPLFSSEEADRKPGAAAPDDPFAGIDPEDYL